MSPRSSRNHSTLVPADSMIASIPHVTVPPRRHATIGNVPASPVVSNDGRPPPSTMSSMPPVPNVIFAMPGARSPDR